MRGHRPLVLKEDSADCFSVFSTNSLKIFAELFFLDYFCIH